jgi:hypothetical protein
VTGKGHRIGAPDETNFEYGLDCILDHAGRLIEEAQKASKATKSAPSRQRKAAKSPAPRARARASSTR